MSKKYQLTVTEEQAKIIKAATDFYSRIACGQFIDIDFLICRQENLFKANVASSDSPAVMNTDKMIKLNDLIEQMIKVFGPSIGILGPLPSNEAQIAWDIHQVIRNKIAWDNKPEGGYTVDFNPPYFAAKSSKENPPEIKKLT